VSAFIRCIRQLVPQEFDGNKIATRYSALSWTCVGVHQKRANIKKRHGNSVQDDVLLNCNIRCKMHTAGRAMYHRDFHTHFCGKLLRANGGIDPK